MKGPDGEGAAGEGQGHLEGEKNGTAWPGSGKTEVRGPGLKARGGWGSSCREW